MAASESNQDQHYGIGAVAKLTGLTDHTIRVWERRYGAVVTQRAANGRRVYRAADVEKLALLKRLTDTGFSIGQIAANNIEQLREQCQDASAMSSAALPERIGLAVLGDYLPARLLAQESATASIDVRVADSNRDRFAADLRYQAVDIVVLETPVLDSAHAEQLHDYMTLCGASRGIIVYGFGRTRDVDRLRQANIVVLRAPVDVEDVHAAVLRSYTHPHLAKAPSEQPAHDDSPDWNFEATIAPRRFNQQQLANLANTSSAIDCECPKHLAQLVGDLSAFEIYSANCANRDDDDAALHRYLQQTTAQARALIEVALQKVAAAEGLSY